MAYPPHIFQSLGKFDLDPAAPFVLAGAVGTAFAALLIVTFIQAAINIIAENN